MITFSLNGRLNQHRLNIILSIQMFFMMTWTFLWQSCTRNSTGSLASTTDKYRIFLHQILHHRHSGPCNVCSPCPFPSHGSLNTVCSSLNSLTATLALDILYYVPFQHLCIFSPWAYVPAPVLKVPLITMFYTNLIISSSINNTFVLIMFLTEPNS